MTHLTRVICCIYLTILLHNASGEDTLNNQDTSLPELFFDSKTFHPSVVLPSSVAAVLPLPITATASCEAGKQYTINNVSDLFNHIGDLECIFAAGETPTNIGLGYHYGTVLTASNTAWASAPVSLVYQGDYVIRTRCSGEETHIGTLHVGGGRPGTAVWSIGELPGSIAEGEYYNPKDNLIMDFRVNLKELCPIEDPEYLHNGLGFFPFKNSVPPINSFVDIGRVVGRDATDGATIFLNKALASHPIKGFATVLFYALKNFDSQVNPTFNSGTPITVSESFTYTRQGLKAPIERLGTAVDIGKIHAATTLRDVLGSRYALTNALLTPGVLPRPVLLPLLRFITLEADGVNEVLVSSSPELEKLLWSSLETEEANKKTYTELAPYFSKGMISTAGFLPSSIFHTNHYLKSTENTETKAKNLNLMIPKNNVEATLQLQRKLGHTKAKGNKAIKHNKIKVAHSE